MGTGKDFTSDNCAPAHPKVLEALARANDGNAPSYGDDKHTAQLKERLSELFGRRVWVFPMFTGTAANAVSLATITPPHGAVFCHEEAHIHVDECGATEMMSGGAKLIPLPGEAGRISLTALERMAARMPKGVMDYNQPATLSLTQPTECGTIYHPSQVAALAGFAHSLGLHVHMDGARFANAVAGSGNSPASLSVESGVDVLCFGLTKDGGISAEAMIFFDEALAEAAIYRQKRAGQVASKMRYVSAQFLALLAQDLWLENARRANDMAFALVEGVTGLGVSPRYPVEVNEVFLELPVDCAARLRADGYAFLDWRSDTEERRGLYRFFTSFATERDDVGRFVRALAAALPSSG